MKMRLSCVLGGLAVVVFAANASAATIAYTTVIQEDIFVANGAANLKNSGEATEDAWIESVLGYEVQYQQLAGSGASAWMEVTGEPDGNNLFAYDFGVGNWGEYFLVKTGNLGNPVFTHFLYNNLVSLQYAVIDVTDFGPGLVIEIGKVSHVGTIPDGGMTLLLLGAALSGLGVARRFLA